MEIYLHLLDDKKGRVMNVDLTVLFRRYFSAWE